MKPERITEGEALSAVGELVAKISPKSTCAFWKETAR